MAGLRVFLSHASADLDAARRVHDWLTAAGHDAFLDQHPHDGIAVGDAWEERLHERLRWADVMVCLVSRAYGASTWCTAEVAIARSRGSRLVPVRAERDATHPLLGTLQYADLTGDATAARKHVLATLRRLTGGQGWDDDRSPFPGLRAFKPDEHRAFFGRDRDVERLAAALRSPGERAKRAALVVVGPSGCGKSSMVRAGLVPTMAAEDGWRVLPPLVPGADPVEALVAASVLAAGRADLTWTPAEVRARLDRDGLTPVANDLLLADTTAPGTQLLVVVDQLEQLVTLTPAAKRARFAALLDAGLAGPVRVVATLRPEFLGPVLADPALAALNPSIEPLAPLGRDALRLVVEGPADLWGVTVPEELVARLVDDTEAGEALPLLAFTLARLTEHVGRGDTITLAAYEALGGVEDALQAQADAAWVDATAATGATRDEVLAVLLTLVAVDAQGRPTGRPRRLDGRPAAVAEAFVERRLLVTAADPDGVATTGVAHETFLSAWSPLRDAIAEAATALRARGAVEEAARDWEERDRPADRLWEKGRLSAALSDLGARVVPPPPPGTDIATAPTRPAWLPGRSRVLVGDRVALDPTSRRFLHASVRRDRFLRNRLVAVLTALLVATGSLAAVAVNRGARLDRELTAASAQLLAAAADAKAVDDPVFATKLALAAWHADTDGPAAREALVRQYLALQSVERVHDRLTDRVITGIVPADPGAATVVLTHDEGATVVTGLPGPTPDAWPVPNAPARARSAVGPDRRRFAVSPDGRRLAVTAEDGAVAVWDIPGRTGPFLLETAGPVAGGTPDALAFSFDGSRLLMAASAGFRPMITAWDLVDRVRLRLPPGLAGDLRVTGLWPTPDPTLLLVRSASDDARAPDRLATRSMSDGSERHVFSPGTPDGPPTGVLSGGRAVVTCLRAGDASAAGGDDVLAVAAADTAGELRRGPLHGECPPELPFSRDGDHVAEPGGSLRIEHETTRLVAPLTGAAVDVTVPQSTFDAGLPGDPTLVVMTGPDGPSTVLVARGKSLLQLRTVPDPIEPVDRGSRPWRHLTPDGSHVLLGSDDGLVVRDAVSGQERGRLSLPNRDDTFVLAANVPDRAVVATRSAEGLQISTFGLPALEPRETYRLPGVDDLGREWEPTVLADADRMVVVALGRLSVLDRQTGRMVGDPVVLGDGEDEQRSFRVARARIRPGRPDQVAVAGVNRPVLLVDLATRRTIARLPASSTLPEIAFEPGGARLAVLTSQGTVEMWDIDGRRPDGTPLFTPSATTLLGFSDDGRLVTGGIVQRLQLWDVGRRTLSATVPLAGGQFVAPDDPIDPAQVGERGLLPVRLPLTARAWADHLCAAIGDWTEAERRVLPVGTQDRRPCP